MCENCERLFAGDEPGARWLVRSNGVELVPGGVSALLGEVGADWVEEGQSPA